MLLVHGPMYIATDGGRHLARAGQRIEGPRGPRIAHQAAWRFGSSLPRRPAQSPVASRLLAVGYLLPRGRIRRAIFRWFEIHLRDVQVQLLGIEAARGASLMRWGSRISSKRPEPVRI